MSNTLVRRIQELCKENDISMYRLAQLSDLPRNTLNNMVSKDRIPTIATIEKICIGLDITMAQFFSSEKLYPDITEKQKQLLMQWESLHLDDREIVLKYMKMLEEHRAAQDDSEKV